MLSGQTTGTAQADLAPDGNLDNAIELPSGRTAMLDVLVVGRSTSVPPESAGYLIRAVVEEHDGAVTVLGASTAFTHEDDGTWNASLVAVVDRLVVRVQGGTLDSVGWVAVIRAAEVLR